MNVIENIKLIVELTKCKVDILKLKADSYEWSCFVDENTRQKLLKTVDDIDKILSSL